MKNNFCIITGASGFIGRNLCRTFQSKSISFRSVVRDSPDTLHTPHAVAINIHTKTNWEEALQGVNIVIHLAGRVHVMQENAQDPLAEFRAMNVDGTLNLARQAAAAGIKRFIFLSSIKVNGEATSNKPFRPSDTASPVDPYGISKHEAEKGLLKIGQATGLEIVIIRPPLVYGREARGNFSRLRKLAAKGWPLPLGAVHNKRSLIGIDNLCDFIRICLDHPAATQSPLLVSDNHDISTPELIRLLAASAGKSIFLPPLPVDLLKILAKLAGCGPEIQRLVSNLQVDCSETMRLLQWTPPLTLDLGIKRCIS